MTRKNRLLYFYLYNNLKIGIKNRLLYIISIIILKLLY